MSDGQVNITGLHLTHPGVTAAVSEALCEAASVCLARHHTPPIRLRVICRESDGEMVVSWPGPSQRARNSHAYDLDATKDGAYAISLICVEHTLRLVAIGQAEIGSGADWYVAPPGRGLDAFGAPDLDDPEVRRLEVSGTDTGSIDRRVQVKVAQVTKGDSVIPGLASVVGFERAVVRIEHAETPQEDQP